MSTGINLLGRNQRLKVLRNGSANASGNCRWQWLLSVLFRWDSYRLSAQSTKLFSQIFFHLIGPAALTYQTLAFSPVRVYELWRFLTYSLLHAGFAHLVINIILQLVIACPLETELSHFQVVLVYTGGVLAGSFAASVSQDSSLMVGASSGVYALLTSHISHICLVSFVAFLQQILTRSFQNFSTISHRLHRIIFVSFLVGSDIAYAIIHCLINGNKEPKVHINAHIAGALSGVLLGFACYGSRRHESAKFKIVWWLSVTCSFGLTFLVIIINISRGS